MTEENEKDEYVPVFTTKFNPITCRMEAFLHCSKCNEKIRQIKEDEKVNVTQPYFCHSCIN